MGESPPAKLGFLLFFFFFFFKLPRGWVAALGAEVLSQYKIESREKGEWQIQTTNQPLNRQGKKERMTPRSALPIFFCHTQSYLVHLLHRNTMGSLGLEAKGSRQTTRILTHLPAIRAGSLRNNPGSTISPRPVYLLARLSMIRCGRLQTVPPPPPFPPSDRICDRARLQCTLQGPAAADQMSRLFWQTSCCLKSVFSTRRLRSLDDGGSGGKLWFRFFGRKVLGRVSVSSERASERASKQASKRAKRASTLDQTITGTDMCRDDKTCSSMQCHADGG